MAIVISVRIWNNLGRKIGKVHAECVQALAPVTAQPMKCHSGAESRRMRRDEEPGTPGTAAQTFPSQSLVRVCNGIVKRLIVRLALGFRVPCPASGASAPE